MSNYVVTTDFTAKDALAPGNPSKIIKGTEFGTEFANIATAVGTKADANNAVLTGTFTFGGVDLSSPLGYLNGVTSAIQTQFDAKAPLASPTFTGTVTLPVAVTASRALVTGASREVAASAVTATELGYLSGVTSAIQTQLNAKYGSGSNVSLGTVSCGAISGTTAGFSGALTALSLQATSSRELKQNIEPVAPGALDRVLKWDVSEYEFKANPGEKEVGLIAEDADPRISTGKAIKTNVALFELAAAVQEIARKMGLN